MLLEKSTRFCCLLVQLPRRLEEKKRGGKYDRWGWERLGYGDEGHRDGDDRRRRRRLTLAPHLASSRRDLPCGDHNDAKVETPSIGIEDDGKKEGVFSLLPSAHAGAVEAALLDGTDLHVADSITDRGVHT